MPEVEVAAWKLDGTFKEGGRTMSRKLPHVRCSHSACLNLGGEGAVAALTFRRGGAR